MTDSEWKKRLIEIERTIKSLQAEKDRMLRGQDSTRRAPSKTLSPEQVDAAFAGIIARAK